jgi:hypothetical protein
MRGVVSSISEVVTVTSESGNTYQYKNLILDTTRYDPYTGQRSEYENYPRIEFGGQKMALLDGVIPGELVEIAFDVQGRNIVNKETGEMSNFTSLRGYKLEKVERQPRAVNTPPTASPAYVPQQPAAPQGNLGDTYYNKPRGAAAKKEQQPDKLPFE